ncbi:MAG: histidinol-phosphate transaminase [Opitutae bacterium]|jgi:histidinol-phosphate aminotransferase|nr:histidinol-phosphate transaminase [Opitutae bacterium]MBT5716268.1 histidinol-phosphate transaminase [Opitutae bacterium]
MSLKDLTAKNIFLHKPYIPGKQPSNFEQTIKLNTNENPYPPSPRISKSILKQIDALARYPNSSADSLRLTIAKLHNVDVGQVIVGNGSDDILNLCVRCFSDYSKSIGMFDPSYSLYEVLGSMQGVEVKKFAFSDPKFEIEPEIISQSGTNLFFLTSPHAPSGRIYNNSIFSSALHQYSGILVIDEAYADFAPFNALSMLNESKRVIITRTLSKSYSLAGLRVGYALASSGIISILNKVREVYNVDRLAQHIAEIALNDREYFEKTKSNILSVRENTHQIFTKWNWKTYESGANFLFTQPIDSRGLFGEEIALNLFNFLSANNVLIRYFPSNPLTSSFLRISIGKQEEMDMLLNLISKWKTTDQQM